MMDDKAVPSIIGDSLWVFYSSDSCLVDGGRRGFFEGIYINKITILGDHIEGMANDRSGDDGALV